MHYFSVPWLQQVVHQLSAGAVYHVAHKKIPAKGDVLVPGVKLEMFIFDPFYMAVRHNLFEVSC